VIAHFGNRVTQVECRPNKPQGYRTGGHLESRTGFGTRTESYSKSRRDSRVSSRFRKSTCSDCLYGQHPRRWFSSLALASSQGSTPRLLVTPATVKSLHDWHRRIHGSGFPIALAITHEDFARVIAAPSNNVRPFSPLRTLFSRNGHPFPSFSELASQIGYALMPRKHSDRWRNRLLGPKRAMPVQ
jgi:hypothetical protein